MTGVKTDDIRYRAAVPADAPAAGRLILDTMGSPGEQIFGFGDPALAERSLGRLFAAGGGRFSYRNGVTAEVEGQPAGLMVSFPGAALGRLEASLSFFLLRIYTPGQLARLAWRSLPAMLGPRTRPDEYYLAHLAVLPEFRRRGIAAELLKQAEAKCRAARLGRISLCVNFGHEEARRLYLAQGYRLSEIFHFPPAIARRLRWEGFESMVKVVDPGE